MDMNARITLCKTALIVSCTLALSAAALFAGNKAKSAEERGIIKSVDANSHQIVVTDKKSKTERTFQWNEQTKFAEHGKTTSASALKSGMAVNLNYMPSSGTPMLKAVKLSPANTQAHSQTSTSKHHGSAKS